MLKRPSASEMGIAPLLAFFSSDCRSSCFFLRSIKQFSHNFDDFTLATVDKSQITKKVNYFQAF
jgi:hypothetical protein